MKTAILSLLTTLLVLTACSLFGSNDDTNRPDIPGKIVFAANDDEGTSQIYTMKASGTNLKQLTHFGPSEGAYQPSWSPDGQQIVFSSFKSGSSIGPALWVMNADGSNQHLLYKIEGSSRALEGNHARWNPAGTQVVFDLCLNCQIRTNNDIYLFDIQTKQVTQLTQDLASDLNATWSPNGNQIAFATDRDYFDGDTLRFRKDLYLMDSDGSNSQRITETGYAREPIWGPVNDAIVFRSTGSIPGLYRVNTKSKEIMKIKDDFNDRTHLHPDSWSPYGNILLITSRQLDPPNTNALQIFDLMENNFVNIYSKSSKDGNQLINGADLYVPLNN